MTLFERVHMPSFAGATEWLNSEPLGPAELQGHVVLVNFWTWTWVRALARGGVPGIWTDARARGLEERGVESGLDRVVGPDITDLA